MPTKFRFNRVLAEGLFRDAAKTGVTFAAVEAENQVDNFLTNPPARTGRIYREGTRTQHQASAPGESPAPDEGKLRQSVVSFVEQRGQEFVGTVGTPLEKSVHLELGTEHIKPRPFMRMLKEAGPLEQIKRAFEIGAKQGGKK